MSDDIRAAAERVGEHANQGITHYAVEDHDDPDMLQLFDDMLTVYGVVQHYLAEHPADDDEPVDMDWFNSVGFAIEIDLFAVRGILSFFRNSKGWNVTVVNSVPVNRGDMTRGDVRRLCAALGVELEGTTPLREGLSK